MQANQHLNNPPLPPNLHMQAQQQQLQNAAQLITPPNYQAIAATNPPQNVSQVLQSFRAAQHARIPFINNDDDDDDDEVDNRSALSINIRAPLTITGNKNLIATDPTAAANAIANGIVTALRGLAAGSQGVPLSDEDGRPRPLLVNVEAECTINGSENIFGERAVLSRLLDIRKTKAERMAMDKAGAASAAAAAAAAADEEEDGATGHPTPPAEPLSGQVMKEATAKINAAKAKSKGVIYKSGTIVQPLEEVLGKDEEADAAGDGGRNGGLGINTTNGSATAPVLDEGKKDNKRERSTSPSPDEVDMESKRTRRE